MTKTEFIKLSRERYGDKFGYTKLGRRPMQPGSEIILTCPIHGDFRTTVRHHLARNCKHGGCPKCELEKPKKTQQKKNTIRKAQAERDDYFVCGGRDTFTKWDDINP